MKPRIGRCQAKVTSPPRRWTAQVRREYLDSLFGQRIISSPFIFRRTSLYQHSGTNLALIYNGSMPTMLMTEYPERAWEVWNFDSKLANWWGDLARKYRKGDTVASAVVAQILSAARGPTSHLARHLEIIGGLEKVSAEIDGSSAVESLGIADLPLSPREWLADPEKQRSYLLHLAQMVGGLVVRINFSPSGPSLTFSAGAGLLRAFKNSPSLTITSVLRDREWKVWKFKHPPKDWHRRLGERLRGRNSEAERTVREIMDHLASQFGIHSLEDWQRYVNDLPTPAMVYEIDQVENILRFLYPHHQWAFQAKISVTTPGDWSSAETRRKALEKFAPDGVESLYQLKADDLRRHSAYRLLRQHASAEALVLIEYPEIAWERWKFGENDPWFAELKAGIRGHDPVALTSLELFATDNSSRQPSLSPRFLKQIAALGGEHAILDHLASFGVPVDKAPRLKKEPAQEVLRWHVDGLE